MTETHTGGGAYVGDDVHAGTFVGRDMHITYQQAAPRPVDAATLAQAQQRLGELPLDRVPDPGVLPHPAHMPFKPNPLFVGRAADLRALAAALRPEGAVVAVTGWGGVGKSQLASAFVHRYGRYFEIGRAHV